MCQKIESDLNLWIVLENPMLLYSSSCNDVPQLQVAELQQYGTMAMLRRRPASILVKVVNKHRARVATVREKCLENDFFPGQGKARKFCGWPGKFRKDLESQGKVREFENK